ncbi:flippase [Clostridium akagii]|uniref:flippase n=1 Tax=Clostridium akagii TaxID=91623 RepID=UPI00047B851F|nr:flippase [Clostridium akagii]
MSRSVAKNYFYNVTYQIIALIIPFITVPYVSRVLGPKGVGINAFTGNNVQYFILFGTIGLSLYGNRTIAYKRDDKEEMSKEFWEIFFLIFSLSIVSYIIFFLLFCINNKYKIIYIFQSISILSTAIDISWLFMGLEDFKKTVTRNLIFKIAGVICVFAFVKTIDDLWKYVFIYSFFGFLGQAIMLLYLPKIVFKPKISELKIKKHVIPALKLFMPQIAISIYAILDKTMLGVLTNVTQVAFYDQSQKLVKMVLVIVTSMSTVMLPRMANTYAKGDNKKLKDYLAKSFIFSTGVSLPVLFGLIGISYELVPWFMGSKFLIVIKLMVIISPIILAISWSAVFGTQYLVPINKNKEFTLTVILGAIVNFVLNLILIPRYQAFGTSIASVAAEWSVVIAQLWVIRNEFNILNQVKEIYKYIIASIFMFALVRIIGSILGACKTTNFIQIAAGMICYILILILFKENLFMDFAKKKVMKNKFILTYYGKRGKYGLH